MKCLRNIILSAFSFLLFLSLSLLFSSSCFATNYSFFSGYASYSNDYGSTWQTLSAPGVNGSVWQTNSSAPNGNFMVRIMNASVAISYSDWQFLDISGSFSIFSWQFQDNLFSSNLCDQFLYANSLNLDFFDGAYDLLSVEEITSVTSCSVSGAFLTVSFTSYVQRDYASTLGYIEVDLFVAPTYSSPNYGGILVCGYPDSVSCTSNWPSTGNYWGWESLDINIEEITDPAVAIMRRQLAIQQQEQQHRQQLEREASDIIDGTGTDGDALSDSATQYTMNILQALIAFRDAMNNVHATDCVIDFPRTNNLTPMGGTFNLGSINFCALSVPTPIMSLATIGISWLMIKLSLWLVRQFYDTYESVIGGK